MTKVESKIREDMKSEQIMSWRSGFEGESKDYYFDTVSYKYDKPSAIGSYSRASFVSLTLPQTNLI